MAREKGIISQASSGWSGLFLIMFLLAAAAGLGTEAANSGGGGGGSSQTNPPAHHSTTGGLISGGTSGGSTSGGTSGGSSGGGTVVESVNIFANFLSVKTGDNYDTVNVSHAVALACQGKKHYSYKSKTCY
jgi:hypothetical protein